MFCNFQCIPPWLDLFIIYSFDAFVNEIFKKIFFLGCSLLVYKNASYFLNILLFIYLFTFGCVGSSFLCEGFL